MQLDVGVHCRGHFHWLGCDIGPSENHGWTADKDRELHMGIVCNYTQRRVHAFPYIIKYKQELVNVIHNQAVNQSSWKEGNRVEILSENYDWIILETHMDWGETEARLMGLKV